MSTPKLAAVKADDSAAVTVDGWTVADSDWDDSVPVADTESDALAVRISAGVLLAHRLWRHLQDLADDDPNRAEIGAEFGRVVHDTAAARAELLSRYVRTTGR
ncbi:MAG: hypothetical protein F4118_11350 [Acidimicrobiaceae bacterium]|nr:hypothetical protein [Acidimicrobiaceae bacterium]MYI37003.1 hypothetical protein [Acidimicrobiaceae bacterium]